jgi:hypothetical protein
MAKIDIETFDDAAERRTTRPPTHDAAHTRPQRFGTHTSNIGQCTPAQAARTRAESRGGERATADRQAEDAPRWTQQHSEDAPTRNAATQTANGYTTPSQRRAARGGNATGTPATERRPFDAHTRANAPVLEALQAAQQDLQRLALAEECNDAAHVAVWWVGASGAAVVSWVWADTSHDQRQDFCVETDVAPGDGLILDTLAPTMTRRRA